MNQPTTREEQRRATRTIILDTVAALIREQGQFTVAEVSERAGISPATIYRYYADRGALLQAAALEDTFRRDSDPEDVADWRDLLRDVWRWQEENFDRIIAVESTPTGREMRAARIRDRQPRVAELMRRAGVDPETPAGQRMLMLWLIVPSSRAFLDFREVFGVDADEGADIVSWAVTALIRATREGWEIGDGLG